ncbi:unnamed protein product [Camellia sinensis]
MERNVVVDKQTNPIQTSLKNIRDHVYEIDEAFESPLYPHPPLSGLIQWCCPTAGKPKLNADGYSKGDPGQAGYGELLRDETGTWLLGYYGTLGHCSSLEAEIWAIYRGLTILFRKGIKGVEIEYDSEQATLQIQHGPNQHSSYKAFIEDARFLLDRCNCSLGHTLQEGNRVADKLANLGMAQQECSIP